MKYFIVLLFIFINVNFSFGRAPLESYKRYMFVLVHGVGGNMFKPVKN